MKTASTLLAVCVLQSGLASTAQADDLVDKGRDISQAHCSRCHVVGDYNPFGGVSSTPSFQLIVNKLSDWEERFSTFYARRPHPSVVRIEGIPPPVDEPAMVFPIQFKLADVEAILAFVRRLKKEPKSRVAPASAVQPPVCIRLPHRSCSKPADVRAVP